MEVRPTKRQRHTSSFQPADAMPYDAGGNVVLWFDRMQIAEIFYSIQGEGRLVGVPSVFVRTSGCNLRCWFCDTPYTSWQPEGEPRSVEGLIDEIARYDCEHVVLTGGEPMLVADLVPLSEQLAARGHHITIETAGTIDLPVHCDLMSISPKLANSTPTPERTVHHGGRAEGWAARHDERRNRPEVICRLTSEYEIQLKFVIDTPEDVADVERWLAEFPAISAEHVWLMPQATDPQVLREKSRWLADVVKQHRWRLSPRLHVELWGNQRGV